MHIKCSNCDATLTKFLIQVDDTFHPTFPDNENTIPSGKYWIGKDLPTTTCDNHIFINLGDAINLKKHPDSSRHNGCCGEDGGDGPNLICWCEVPVATKVSDCWTSYYIHFEPELIKISE